MNWLAPKLNLRVAQKQILTPGLVQMVSVLALNRLELREMINQEIMANPVLDEVAEGDAAAQDSYTDEAFPQEGNRKSSREAGSRIPSTNSILAHSFRSTSILGRSAPRAVNAKRSSGLPSTSSSLPRRTLPTI